MKVRYVVALTVILVAAIVVTGIVAFNIHESNKTEEKIRKFNEAQTELAKIKREFQRLEMGNNIVAEAQSNEACAALDLLRAYQTVQSEYERIGVPEESLALRIDNRVMALGRKAASLGYEGMKQRYEATQQPTVPKPVVRMRCYDDRPESDFFNDFLDVMGKYGPASGQGEFESHIVRAAYLSALKPEVAKAIKEMPEFWDDNEQPGARSNYLPSAVKPAIDQWGFTLDELGISEKIATAWGLLGVPPFGPDAA